MQVFELLRTSCMNFIEVAESVVVSLVIFFLFSFQLLNHSKQLFVICCLLV